VTGQPLLESWLAEERTPFSGWDFAHLDGRAVEDPLPWSYLDIVRSRLVGARSLLDLGTGGGEVLSELRDSFPSRVVATEAYAPNVAVARQRLGPLGVDVVPYEADDNGALLPFADASFDVIISRHEAYTPREVARVLTREGAFVTQQVAGDYLSALRAAFGARDQWPHVTLANFVEDLRAAGFLIDLAQESRGNMTFRDVSAIVYFLHAIPWEVPGFSVQRHEPVLRDLQRRLELDGALRFATGHFLIAARKP
jgi:SAM-dependent methyltransferase